MSRQQRASSRATEVDPGNADEGQRMRRSRDPLLGAPGMQLAALRTSAGNQALARVLATSAPPVQRRVILGSTELTSAPPEKRSQGTGPHRNVGEMIDGRATHYFSDEAEMLAYAAGRTENMGYLEKKSAWIRIPTNRITVLGENHGRTTLTDVANAIGTRRYRYEPFNDIPAELLRRSKRMRQTKASRDSELSAKVGSGADARSHAGDELMPKVVIGLVGLRTAVADAVKARAAKAKAAASAGGAGYSRQEAELRMLSLGVLTAAKSAKYDVTPQPLWTAHRKVFNKTAEQLREGRPLQATALIAAIAAAKFTFEDLVDSFKQASRDALAAAGLDAEFAEFATEREDMQASSQPDAPEFERMREFHMVKKIEKAERGGDLLFGMGDVHRGHIEKQLDDMGIYVRSIAGEVSMPSRHPTFIAEQLKDHPQS